MSNQDQLKQMDGNPAEFPIVEEIEIPGHIIDSLILPKVLDSITASGGKFRIASITIGQNRNDPSYAVIELRTRTPEAMDRIVAMIADHGAVPTTKQDCRLTPADMDGAFPEAFYSTTNQRTEIRIEGHWVSVADQEMDCGIVVEGARNEERGASKKPLGTDPLAPRSSLLAARCVPMIDVRRGMQIVTG